MIVHVLLANILNYNSIAGIYSTYERAETARLLILLQQKLECTIKPFIIDKEYGGSHDTKN